MDSLTLIRDYIKPMLMAINSDIQDVVYVENCDREYVIVMFEWYDISIKITGDSPMAVLKDISTKLLRKGI